ncbi:MAG: immunity 45 family protein [Novosphingobium sp.]|jgi:hypothetical protein|nr:immunity 45 family protein [Novosphingobium sp.]
MWKKLLDICDNEALYRGSIFRLPGKYPYENIVDFMLIDYPVSGYGFTIVVASGYKAGLIVCSLPIESFGSNPKIKGVSGQWIKQNWAQWIYPEADINDVYLSKGYPAPKSFSE